MHDIARRVLLRFELGLIVLVFNAPRLVFHGGLAAATNLKFAFNMRYAFNGARQPNGGIALTCIGHIAEQPGRALLVLYANSVVAQLAALFELAADSLGDGLVGR
jgi:hypothetical protein